MKVNIINFLVLSTTAVLLSACHKPAVHQNKTFYSSHELSALPVLENSSREDVSVSKYKGNNASLNVKSSNACLDSVGEAQIWHDVTGKHSKNTMLNLLLPIHDSGQQVFFTQLGMNYNTDNKKILNIGVGERHFYDDWMLGYSAFYDVQTSGNTHQRLGAGVELWRDYLHFSGAGYYGLTKGYQVHSSASREERIAQGYDFRAQAWIPQYPQMSGRVKFEQYFGNSFPSFNRDSHVKNKYALSWGGSYTPIPLLSLNVDHISSNKGQSDTRLGLSVRYQIGGSLLNQLDPQRVGMQGKLADSRYRSVERNNVITLKYQDVKKSSSDAFITMNETTGQLIPLSSLSSPPETETTNDLLPSASLSPSVIAMNTSSLPSSGETVRENQNIAISAVPAPPPLPVTTASISPLPSAGETVREHQNIAISAVPTPPPLPVTTANMSPLPSAGETVRENQNVAVSAVPAPPPLPVTTASISPLPSAGETVQENQNIAISAVPTPPSLAVTTANVSPLPSVNEVKEEITPGSSQAMSETQSTRSFLQDINKDVMKRLKPTAISQKQSSCSDPMMDAISRAIVERREDINGNDSDSDSDSDHNDGVGEDEDWNA